MMMMKICFFDYGYLYFRNWVNVEEIFCYYFHWLFTNLFDLAVQNAVTYDANCLFLRSGPD